MIVHKFVLLNALLSRERARVVISLFARSRARTQRHYSDDYDAPCSSVGVCPGQAIEYGPALDPVGQLYLPRHSRSRNACRMNLIWSQQLPTLFKYIFFRCRLWHKTKTLHENCGIHLLVHGHPILSPASGKKISTNDPHCFFIISYCVPFLHEKLHLSTTTYRSTLYVLYI